MTQSRHLTAEKIQRWKASMVQGEPITELFDSHEAWRYALLDLTPGGSEFVDEPVRCADFVRGRLKTNTELVLRAKQAEAELARTKRALEMAMLAMKDAHKACCCNRNKGFDYGEKHPTMGISKHGRWLSPKELLSGALLDIKKELGE